MDIDDMIKGIPEHALTHKGCPRCCGTKQIRLRTGNIENKIECHYYGQAYRIRDRMIAGVVLEKE